MRGNAWAYNLAARYYDILMEEATRDIRPGAVSALELAAEERLLIVGIGTGLDLPLLPRDQHGLGLDLSEGMLREAARRVARLGMPNFELRQMDAQALDLPDRSFDAVYLPLIVAVVPDGAAVLREAARVVKPGGQVVVFDKFWPEHRSLPPGFRGFSELVGRLASHLDRRWSEIHAAAPGLEVLKDEPVLLRGYFRLITLRSRD